MPTKVVSFPFDLFGSAGTGAGAMLLADVIREMLADSRRERVPVRGHAYCGQVQLREATFNTALEYQNWRTTARRLAQPAIDRGDFLVWLGGNHLSVLPILELLGRNANSVVIQFDAHPDVYHLSDCTTELSHGNFLLHADGPLPAIAHVGNRDLFLTVQHLANYFRVMIPATDSATASTRLAKETASADRIWLDLDCDVFDPAYFPAVLQPEPFGLSPLQLLSMIDAVWSDRVAGISISEFAPARDRDDRSLQLLGWFLEYLLLKLHEPKAKK
jgi:arginase family enzyme